LDTPTNEKILIQTGYSAQNLQCSHSFKYRGMSLFAQRCKEKYGPSVHLIIASGGNAGLAVACAANALSLRCTVFLPQGASLSTVKLMERQGAQVVVVGKCHSQALSHAEETVKSERNA
jgi:L-serine/L-threonine ammonia-lyase